MNKVIKFFRQTQEGLLELFAKKNSDYGNDQIREFGDYGIFIRANDKMNRLKHIYKKKIMITDETIEDTWRDLAVYSVMAVMYINGHFKEDD